LITYHSKCIRFQEEVFLFEQKLTQKLKFTATLCNNFKVALIGRSWENKVKFLLEADEMKRTIQEKINLTVQWLKEQVKHSGTSGLVVGISGGIDSALVTFLIKKAFPEQSLGVILPCKSNPKDKEDALKVVAASGIASLEVDLTNAHKAIFDQTAAALETIGRAERSERLADANLRARLRMSTLYTVANSLNYLVVGTDNAAETYTGYFTKYGDGGVDILPVSHLTKREIRAWAEAIGVPNDILIKAPSAGLWEGQTDEAEMGTTYDRVDDFLEGKEIPAQDREIIERLHRRSAHKRMLPPSPPKY
jgi:NAD+ synthase